MEGCGRGWMKPIDYLKCVIQIYRRERRRAGTRGGRKDRGVGGGGGG